MEVLREKEVLTLPSMLPLLITHYPHHHQLVHGQLEADGSSSTRTTMGVVHQLARRRTAPPSSRYLD